MIRIAIIHAWFGSFPNYFNLWLNSCRRNKTIDFYILTDEDIDGGENIFPVKTTLANLKDQFESYLGYKISLEKPYKLCDYKIIFHTAIPDIERNYDFWGFCDCDLIFGNIRKFVTDEVLAKFQYIGVLGHFHLQKTNYQLFNRLLRQSRTLEGYTCRDVFTSPHNYIIDELPYGIPRQVLDECPEEAYSLFFSDHRCFESPNDTIPGFIDSFNNADELGNRYKGCIFDRYSKDIDCWKRNSGSRNKKWIFYKYDKGILKCCFWENDCYEETEILYVHLFRRKMNVLIDETSESYNIIPNKFIDKSVTKFDVKKSYAIDFFRCQKIYFRRKYYDAKSYIWTLLHS